MKEMIGKKLMNDQMVAKCIPEPWYHWWRFSVLPMVRIKSKTEHDSGGFDIRWLVFRAWTLSSPGIGLQISLESTHFDFYVLLPYLKAGASIPLAPMNFGYWVQRKFWRTGSRRYG